MRKRGKPLASWFVIHPEQTPRDIQYVQISSQAKKPTRQRNGSVFSCENTLIREKDYMQWRASQPTSMKRGLHLSYTSEILQAHYWTGKQNCEVMDMICLKWETVSQCKVHACSEVWLLVSECHRRKELLKWIKAHLQTKEKVLARINY